jgi:uncharacterized protein (TIGR04255 family)
MAKTSPHFDQPPVVETVLGVQFAPLAGFTNGHLGWYWKRYLDEEWSRATDAPPLTDQFETFDAEGRWGLPGLQLILGAGVKPGRLQITTAAGDRLLQVQATQFHYNWQKREGSYPSYSKMRAEFDHLFANFCRFVAEAGLGEVIPNQWEFTYVDHIQRGALWDSPADWHKVLPGLLAPGRFAGIRFEGLNGDWHYEIEPRRGRLHIVLQHVRVGAPSGPEAVQVRSTARGPVRQEPGWDLDNGLQLGHDVLLNTFLQMTSAEAQRAWGGGTDGNRNN